MEQKRRIHREDHGNLVIEIFSAKSGYVWEITSARGEYVARQIARFNDQDRALADAQQVAKRLQAEQETDPIDTDLENAINALTEYRAARKNSDNAQQRYWWAEYEFAIGEFEKRTAHENV